MAKFGWLSLITGLAMLASGCEQSNPNAGQNGDNAEVLAATESYKDFGEYGVHFNALTTDQLTQAIAEQYEIVRSKNRVLLNISIVQNQEIGLPTAVAAEVTAMAKNLTGQLRRLPVSEIREGQAIYYIAQIPIVNAETLIFTVEATPESATEPLTVNFQKQFFVND